MTEKIEEKPTIVRKKKKETDAKTAKLINKIFILLSVVLFLLTMGIFAIKNFLQLRGSYGLELKNLQKHHASLSNQIQDLESKSSLAQRYIKMWQEEFTERQKSREGISIDRAKEILKNLSAIHNVSNLQINFSTPALMSGAFEKNNIKVQTTLIDIKFNTITDVNVLNFIQDVEKEMPNFILLTNLSMSRTKKITDDYFESLKRGLIIPTLAAEVKFQWYGISPINEP